jgi:hypothetical protein
VPAVVLFEAPFVEHDSKQEPVAQVPEIPATPMPEKDTVVDSNLQDQGGYYDDHVVAQDRFRPSGSSIRAGIGSARTTIPRMVKGPRQHQDDIIKADRVERGIAGRFELISGFEV